MDWDNPIAAMKLRWSHIQPLLFPFLREEVNPLTEKLERLIVVLDSIGLESFVRALPDGPGRPRDDRRAIARGFVAKAVLGVPTTRALVERLQVDGSLRRICGWERRAEVPSEATFSRAFGEFANDGLPERMHEALVKRAFGDRIVGVVARDATEIEAREKPAKKDDDPPPAQPSRLERQTTQSLDQMRAELPQACDVGTKKNSKGYKESWIGYKLHIDTACGQIPVSLILTSASPHDSQVAIPLMTMTSQRITYLYEVMDSAYDAATIDTHSRTLGHTPVIDPNFRANRELKAEWSAETKRRAFINMPDFDDAIYNFRTMAERVNARLKDEFGARFVRVRGAVKVKCHLMFGALALTVDQIFHVREFENAPAPA